LIGRAETIKHVHRFRHVDIIYYVLTTIKEIKDSQPKSFKETIEVIEGQE